MENQAITWLLTSSKDKQSSLNSNKRLKIFIAKKRDQLQAPLSAIN